MDGNGRVRTGARRGTVGARGGARRRRRRREAADDYGGRAEAKRLIDKDDDCTNTIVVLLVGGGEGNTGGLTSADAAAAASGFVNIKSSRRVPIYVIAIAPPQADVAGLKLIATNSGGKYIEITKTMIDAAMSRDMFPWSTAVTDAAHPNQNKLLTQDDSNHDVYVPLPMATTTYPTAGTIVVPELVAAINTAVQHGMADAADVNAAPTVAQPYGPISEFQVTSPIVGTVNMEGAKDINGTALPNTIVYDKAVPPNKIPQRSNVLLTTSLLAPGFTGQIRAFRQYIPVVDATQPSGYKFKADNATVFERRLWVAKVPTNVDGTVNAAARNLYTATTDGTLIAFNTANSSNLATIATMMGLSGVNATSDATTIINAVRGLPFGPVVSSTPAMMNPPSLDPPPDDDYPAFASANKDRRSMIWVGTNYGILEGLDARLGVEVWGFIPPTLLPKLKTLRLGQGVTNFTYFMDGSPMRMQRDAPSDPRCAPGAANSSQCTVDVANASSSYYDPFVYTKTGAPGGVGVSSNATATYRRKYVNLTFNNNGTTKATVSAINVVTDQDKYIDWGTPILGLPTITTLQNSYKNFEAPTRLSIVRAAIFQAVLMNQNDAQFGIISMRQKAAALPIQGNYANISSGSTIQNTAGGDGGGSVWTMSVPRYCTDTSPDCRSDSDNDNGQQSSKNQPVDVKSDDDDASSKMLTMISKASQVSPGGSLPAYAAAGNDGWYSASGHANGRNNVDAPIKFMLDDASKEGDAADDGVGRRSGTRGEIHRRARRRDPGARGRSARPRHIRPGSGDVRPGHRQGRLSGAVLARRARPRHDAERHHRR